MERESPARRSSVDGVRTRDLLYARIRKLGTQGLYREWLVRHGGHCFGDWQAAVDELVESGLVERRRVLRWGLSPPGRPTSIVYFARGGVS